MAEHRDRFALGPEAAAARNSPRPGRRHERLVVLFSFSNLPAGSAKTDCSAPATPTAETAPTSSWHSPCKRSRPQSDASSGLPLRGPSTVQCRGYERAVTLRHRPHPEMGRLRAVCRTGAGLCCCTSVPDPGGLSFGDTDGCGERTSHPSPDASLERTGRVLCPVAQALGPAVVPPPPHVRPCQQRATRSRDSRRSHLAAGWSLEPRRHAPPTAHHLSS